MRPITLKSLVPDVETLLALSPSELAVPVLEMLRDPENEQFRSKGNFHMGHIFESYPRPAQPRVKEALAAVWSYMERENLIMPRGIGSGDWYELTERGKQYKAATALVATRMPSYSPSSCCTFS